MTPTSDDDLRQRRMAAAVASKGTSSDTILAAVIGVTQVQEFQGSLLDFGAGTGSLARELLRTGYSGKITGADILSRPIGLPRSIDWVTGDLNLPIKVEDGTFDCIVSTEVIEHLENPRAVFREFHRLLKPTGLLLVTTPNQESLRSLLSLLLAGHFVYFLDRSYPAHITALLRLDFQRICSETKFAPPAFYYTNKGGLPKLPSLNWQTISLGLLKGRLFSDNVLVVAKKIGLAHSRMSSKISSERKHHV
jgi:2-polyprenyl-3-methyl-5-hydroxy-6-metoxy-1,4-benzoquinol methylase